MTKRMSVSTIDSEHSRSYGAVIILRQPNLDYTRTILVLLSIHAQSIKFSLKPTPNSPHQEHVTRHDGHPLGVDRGHIRQLEQLNEKSLGRFLQRVQGRTLDAEVREGLVPSQFGVMRAHWCSPGFAQSRGRGVGRAAGG